MTKAEILRAAANRIREKGFCAKLGTPEGPCCWIGSINAVSDIAPDEGFDSIDGEVHDDASRSVVKALRGANTGHSAGRIYTMLNDGVLTQEIAADFLDDLAAAVEVDPSL